MEAELILELSRIRKAILIQHKDILSLDEVVLYTGFGIDHIHKLTQSGALPVYKPGGKKCFVKKEDLHQYLLRNRIESNDEHEEQATNQI